jgi:DNA sulfur modification protein DndE
MKPPVETVRISSRGREILIKIKRNTGIDRWNEICRVALCHSLANKSRPPKAQKSWDSAIEIEWKTFSGELSDVLASAVLFRAKVDGIDVTKKDGLSDYFRAHLERGISAIQNSKGIAGYVEAMVNSDAVRS